MRSQPLTASFVAQIEEVQGVQQILDPEEEVALQEFARFEEKLRQTPEPTVVAQTMETSSSS